MEGWRDGGMRDEGWRDEGWRDEGWRDGGMRDGACHMMFISYCCCPAGVIVPSECVSLCRLLFTRLMYGQHIFCLFFFRRGR